MIEYRQTVVLLMLAGAGLGAVVAKLVGVSSWLDAKLYLVFGALGGAIVHYLFKVLSAKRNTQRNGPKSIA